MAPLAFLLLLLGQTLLCTAVDTISSTTPLSGKQTIVSKGKKFTLGFYLPQSNTTSSRSSSYYIAIWYTNILPVTTVWTAATDVPVSDPTTTVLVIGSDGNLVLLDQSRNRSLWSTNVMVDQSITLDKPTGVSPGLFSLELDPSGTQQFFIQWNDSISYWTSGRWNGNGFRFPLAPEMSNLQFFDNDHESYFHYSMKDDSIISRFIIDVSGQITQLTWMEISKQWVLFWSQPQAQCEVYALCGAYGSCNSNGTPYCNCVKGFSQKIQNNWDLQDYSGGCKRNTPLQCQTNPRSAHTQSDMFFAMEDVRLPDNSRGAVATSYQECQTICLKNCSCNGFHLQFYWLLCLARGPG